MAVLGFVACDPAFTSDRAAIIGGAAWQHQGLVKVLIRTMVALPPPVSPEAIIDEVQTAQAALAKVGIGRAHQKIVVDAGGVGVSLARDLLAIAPMTHIIFTRATAGLAHTIQPQPQPIGAVRGQQTAVPVRLLSRMQLLTDLRAAGHQQRIDIDKEVPDEIVAEFRGEANAARTEQDRLGRERVVQGQADDLIAAVALLLYAAEHATDWRRVETPVNFNEAPAVGSRGWT